MKKLSQQLAIILLVIAFSLFEFTSLVNALPYKPEQKPNNYFSEKLYLQSEKAQQPGSIELTIEELKPFTLGDHPTIYVHLKDELGKPIANQSILIFVDGARKASGQTDSRGIASIALKYKFTAGAYHIQAYYAGGSDLNLPFVSVEAEMVIQSAEVEIRTVPPMAGVKFNFNDQIYTSDENGFVNIQIDESGYYDLEVLEFDNTLLSPDVKMEFERWNDNVFTPDRQVYFPRNRPLEVGFVFKYLVDQVFFDSNGALVDPARISGMSIRGVGSFYNFDKAGPIWLPANRLIRRTGERLHNLEILYYIRDIEIDGANVINQSQQRFQIRPNDVWPIQVLLYSAHFSGRDAMFNFPVGRGIALTYPDGHTEEFLFDSPNAEIEIPSLARGSYSAIIIGGWGSALATPIHLSKDLAIDIPLISYLDMAVIIGVPLLFALILLFIGRPKIFHAIRHPSQFRDLLSNHIQKDVSSKT